MEEQIVSDGCVALTVRGGLKGADRASSLVRSALELRGLKVWPRMEISVFSSRDSSLILARPAQRLTVTVADWALPFFDT